MRIGQLRYLVEIGRYAEGQDPDTGDPIPSQWQSVAQVWASVEGLSGSHLFQAQMTVDRSTHRVVIRYRPDIEPGMVVRHDGRELVVVAALDEDGKRRWLTLTCREVRPA